MFSLLFLHSKYRGEVVASPQEIVKEERDNDAPCRQSSPNSNLFGVKCCLFCQVGVLLAPVPGVLLDNYSFQVEMGLVAEWWFCWNWWAFPSFQPQK